MYQLRGMSGVTQILGHFEDDRWVGLACVQGSARACPAVRQPPPPAGPRRCRAPPRLRHTPPCCPRRYVHIVMEKAAGGDLYRRASHSPPLDEHWVCTKVGVWLERPCQQAQAQAQVLASRQRAPGRRRARHHAAHLPPPLPAARW